MIVKDLRNSFNPVPKTKRIVNKKILKDKKGICEICNKKGQTEKHHIKTKGAGGNDTKENLIEVCRICHIKIHGRQYKSKNIKGENMKYDILIINSNNAYNFWENAADGIKFHNINEEELDRLLKMSLKQDYSVVICSNEKEE